jgi:hypothetical protein
MPWAVGGNRIWALHAAARDVCEKLQCKSNEHIHYCIGVIADGDD